MRIADDDDGTLGRGGVAPSWARMGRALAANPDLEPVVAESLTKADTTLPEPVRTPLLFIGRRTDPRRPRSCCRWLPMPTATR